MVERVSDEAVATAVLQAVTALNAKIADASRHGLQVDIETIDVTYVGARPYQLVKAEVSRTLGKV